MVNRIKNICKNRKIPISTLEHDLDFSNGYIANLKKDSIPADRLYMIAKYLNLSIEYLITGEENKEYISPEERNLVEQYRKILPEGQKNIKKYIEFELYKQEDK